MTTHARDQSIWLIDCIPRICLSLTVMLFAFQKVHKAQYIILSITIYTSQYFGDNHLHLLVVCRWSWMSFFFQPVDKEHPGIGLGV